MIRRAITTVNKYVVVFSIVTLIFVQANVQGTESDFSYKHFMSVLDKYVDDFGLVNYFQLKQERTDLDKFTRSLSSLSEATFKTWSAKDRIAFWVNAYNALTLKVIIDHLFRKSSSAQSNSKPITSIRQIPGVWSKIKFNIMQRKLTLDDIEHEILRKKFREPRIHFALNCASKGCPVLRKEPYTGDKLDLQLEAQTKLFLSNRQNFYIDKIKKKVYLSSIFKWYGKDFIDVYSPKSGFAKRNKKEKAVLYFISLHLEEEDSALLDEGNLGVKYLKYDWSLNARRTP
ncbi:DUF547 domain-containing protein [Acidobacteriota bacterium]